VAAQDDAPQPPTRALVMTGNLGQLYDRLPRPEADAEVMRLLGSAGYNADFDVLVDLGGSAAPTLQYLDVGLSSSPRFEAESSYGVGALAVLRQRGLGAAAYGPREALLQPSTYASDASGLREIYASNARLAGQAHRGVSDDFALLEGAPELLLGALLHLPTVEALSREAARRLRELPWAMYSQRPPADALLTEATPDAAMPGERVVLATVAGEGTMATPDFLDPRALSPDGCPYVVVRRVNPPMPDRVLRSSSLEEKLRDAVAIAFDAEILPTDPLIDQKTLGSFSFSHEWTSMPGEESEQVEVPLATYTRKDRRGRHALARAEMVWRGGPPVEGAAPPSAPRYRVALLRDPDGIYTLHVDKPLALGDVSIGNEDLQRLFGFGLTAANASARLEKLGNLRDLVQPLVRAMALVEQAALAQGLTAPGGVEPSSAP